MYHLIAYLVLDRADKTCFEACRHKDILDNAGGRGLSVRTGNAYQRHFPFRMTEPRRTELSVHLACIADDYLSVAEPEVALAYHRSSALFKHFPCGVVTVESSALYADKEAAVSDFPRIVSERGYLGITDSCHSVFFDKVS